MKLRETMWWIFSLVKSLVIFLSANMLAGLAIIFGLSRFTSLGFNAINYGLTLSAIGLLYLLMGYGSFNGSVEQNTSIGLMMARSVSVGDHEERRDGLRAQNQEAASMTAKLFVVGLATIAIAYVFLV